MRGARRGRTQAISLWQLVRVPTGGSALLALLVIGGLMFEVTGPFAEWMRPSGWRTRRAHAAAVRSSTVPQVPTASEPVVPSGLPRTRQGPKTPASVELTADLAWLASANRGMVGIALTELDGPNPLSWSWNGDRAFKAASLYKLPLLMAEAEAVAAERLDPNGQVCFEEGDWEDGWFVDYRPGACFSRSTLAWRAGHTSDNTAAQMLVRDLGGADALNRFARSHGAGASAFYDSNLTTPNDVAR